MQLVAGEAGVGRGGLIGRFAEQAQRAPTLVAVGGAAPLTGGALPYAPLLQALQSLADGHETAASGGPGAELAGMLAELTGDRPPGERGSPEMGRARLFERLRRLFGGLARAVPLLLVLEDLHWADSATLDVLAFVLRTLRGARLLIVGSYRADDPGELLAGWLAEMRRIAGSELAGAAAFHPGRADRPAGGAAGRAGKQPGGGGGFGPVAGKLVTRRAAGRGRGTAPAGCRWRGCGRCCWPGWVSCRLTASSCCGWRQSPAGGSAMIGWRR